MTIAELYSNNISYIRSMKEASHGFRSQDYETGIQNMRSLIRDLPNAFQLILQNQHLFNGERVLVSEEDIVWRLTSVTEAFETRDYILLTDYLEQLLIPFLYDLQEELRKTGDYILSKLDQNLQAMKTRDGLLASELNRDEVDIYEVEDTSTGAMTMALSDDHGSYYLHSNIDPYNEAKQMAQRYNDAENCEYIIYGMGLGYFPLAMILLCEGNKVKVFDGDLKVIKTALVMNDFSPWIANGSMEIVYDPRYVKLKKQLKEMDGKNFIIHSPSVRNIKDASNREAIQSYFVNANGMLRMETLLNHNFNQNIKLLSHSVWECEKDIAGKSVVIVAAGPSLDKNVQLLKNKPKDVVVMAVSTAFHKLADMGIAVDYVIHTDAQAKTLWHFRDMYEEQVPLFLLSTATYELANAYQGPKYLACQSGFDKAEEYARTKQEKTFETGGSVATTALDIAISLGAKECALVGLDLAYTGFMAHASDTSQREVDKKASYIMVPGVCEEQVPTNTIFLSMIQWFEQYIKKMDTVKIYDATEGGARIKGTTILSLKEYLDDK